MADQTFERVPVAYPQVLVLADGGSQGARNHAKGRLFEDFMARVLHRYGYGAPSRTRQNVTSDGVEIDIATSHRITGQAMIVECKAYSSPLDAGSLNVFIGKLTQARYTEPRTHGIFVALPALGGPGDEQARHVAQHDADFTYLHAEHVVDMLDELHIIGPSPRPIPDASDHAVVVTEHGIYSATLGLDPHTRSPIEVLVWSRNGSVPQVVLDLVASSPYAKELPVTSLTDSQGSHTIVAPSSAVAPLLARVEQSTSDFDYFRPAAPRYFVGRRPLVATFDELLDGGTSVVVLNAQSGWGKSSLALKLRERAVARRGFGVVFDSRTASGPRYVTEALREVAHGAEDAGVLRLPQDAAWGSLQSALRSIGASQWLEKRGPVVVFFDQFENVFSDRAVTRDFRDLALGVRGLSVPMVVGFAWKTDLVGWTEEHPYALRDQIRSSATVLALRPLGASEVNTVLSRLEREIRQKLSRDLRQRLREYSQGLPWLLKKLAGHILTEIRDNGVSQEQLASDALNVQGLFDSDLAELGPTEQEALRLVARYAPISASEVTERTSATVVQSLVDKRLIVQVGERLDTYWDIFRDYLNRGYVPIEDSYIIRLSPISVARLLRLVARTGNGTAVSALANSLGAVEASVYNLSRELRSLGIASADQPHLVRINQTIWDAEDREEAIRRQVNTALRRHKAYTAFNALAERSSEVTAASYARELPTTFPAVAAADNTWAGYARAFLLWFEYAGLAMQRDGNWVAAPEGYAPTTYLLSAESAPLRVRRAFPHDPPGPSLRLALAVRDSNGAAYELRESGQRRAAVPLLRLGVLEQVARTSVRLAHPGYLSGDQFAQEPLRECMLRVPGAAEGFAVLQVDPAAAPNIVGRAVREGSSADWNEATTLVIGKHFRAWARAAGVQVRRRSSRSSARTALAGEGYPVAEALPGLDD